MSGHSLWNSQTKLNHDDPTYKYMLNFLNTYVSNIEFELTSDSLNEITKLIKFTMKHDGSNHRIKFKYKIECCKKSGKKFLHYTYCSFDSEPIDNHLINFYRKNKLINKHITYPLYSKNNNFITHLNPFVIVFESSSHCKCCMDINNIPFVEIDSNYNNKSFFNFNYVNINLYKFNKDWIASSDKYHSYVHFLLCKFEPYSKLSCVRLILSMIVDRYNP